jgi:hypothetical protein
MLGSALLAQTYQATYQIDSAQSIGYRGIFSFTSKDVNTTMIYTHVLNQAGGRGVQSPADNP